MMYRQNRIVPLLAALFVALLAAACGVFPLSAFANRQMEAPVQVSDDVTRVHIVKLDKDTHEQVKGAHLAVIEKSSGSIVDEWTTSSSVHHIEKELDVNVTYILRELSAPSGYSVAQDTEFRINETEGEGVTILSGTDAELSQSYRISLYDAPTDITTTTTEYRDRTTPSDTGSPESNTSTQGNPGTSSTPSSGSSQSATPKTGDVISVTEIAAIACMGLFAVVILLIARRKLTR